MNVFKLPIEELDSLGLDAVGADHAGRVRIAHHFVAVDHPLALAVDLLDLRNPVLPFGGRMCRPQIVGFAEMRIDVDHLDARKRIAPGTGPGLLNCGGHEIPPNPSCWRYWSLLF